MTLGFVLHMECAKQRIVTWQVVFDWFNTVHIVGVELNTEHMVFDWLNTVHIVGVDGMFLILSPNYDTGFVLHMECAKQRIITWQVVFDWLNTVHIVGVELKSISCVVPLVLLMLLTLRTCFTRSTCNTSVRIVL